MPFNTEKYAWIVINGAVSYLLDVFHYSFDLCIVFAASLSRSSWLRRKDLSIASVCMILGWRPINVRTSGLSIAAKP